MFEMSSKGHKEIYSPKQIKEVKSPKRSNNENEITKRCDQILQKYSGKKKE